MSIFGVLALALGGGCSSSLPVGGGGGAGHGGETGGGGTFGGRGGRDGGQTDGLSHDGAGGVGGPCWVQSDCPLYATCSSPGPRPCPGVCEQSNAACQVDSDCAAFDAGTDAPLVCDLLPCGGCGVPMGCLPGCGTDADCALGTSCGGDHRCAPSPCAPGGASCPIDFTCGSNGVCARKTCSADSQCSKACVLGACYGAPGTCYGATA